jgi:hypothetical protein
LLEERLSGHGGRILKRIQHDAEAMFRPSPSRFLQRHADKVAFFCALAQFLCCASNRLGRNGGLKAQIL